MKTGVKQTAYNEVANKNHNEIAGPPVISLEARRPNG